MSARGTGLVLLFLAAAPLCAQVPAERTLIATFRDSLRHADDIPAIELLERRLQRKVDTARDDGDLRLRLGFTQLRHGELAQERGPFDDANATFTSVIGNHADWPLAYVGRGLARMNLESDGWVQHTLLGVVATDGTSGAANDLAASGRDPACADGLLEAVNVAAATMRPVHARTAERALRAIASLPIGNLPVIQIARMRAEQLVGASDSAIALATAYLRLHPGDPAALLVLGRSGMTVGFATGADDWFTALARADTGLLRVFRGDLQLIFPDSARRRFDERTDTARANYVRAFLALDDPELIRTANERLREHYQRLDTARIAFALPAGNFAADAATGFDPSLRGVDDRGLVWVLHGPPDAETHIASVGIPPNLSWRYTGVDGGEMLFHFVRLDDSAGYQRVPSLFDLLALSTAARVTGQTDMRERTLAGTAIMTYGGAWTARTAQVLLASRDHLSHVYDHLYSMGRDSAAALQAAEREVGDSSMLVGETWALHYELPLDAAVEPLAVGSDQHGTLLQVPFAIAGSSLYAPPRADGAPGVVYPIRMRVTVIGARGLVARIDTTRQFLAPYAVPVGGALSASLPIPLPPGTYAVRVAVETASRGVVSRLDTVTVAPLHGQAPTLSDLALGLRSGPRWTNAARDTIWFNPSRKFDGREPMELAFEVGGLAVRETYHIDVAILRHKESAPALKVSFDARASGAIDQVRRAIDVSHLPGDDYQLQVTITDKAGARVTRRGAFIIDR